MMKQIAFGALLVLVLLFLFLLFRSRSVQPSYKLSDEQIEFEKKNGIHP